MTVPDGAVNARHSHSLGSRILLCLLGGIFAICGLAAGGVLIVATRFGTRTPYPLALIPAVLLLAAIGGYGIWLVSRGVRGWSRQTALDRASFRFERVSRELSFGLWMVVGFLAWIATDGRVPGSPGLLVLWSLAVGAIGTPLWVAFHELGHLVPALTQGRKLQAFRAWPIEILRADDGALRVGLRVRNTDGLLGLTLVSPISAGAEPDRLVFVGGPAASGGVAVLLGLVVFAGHRGLPDAGRPAFLLGGAIINAFLCVANATPWRSANGWVTDGLRFLRTFRPAYHALVVRDQVLLLQTRARPRDWKLTSAELESVATESGASADERAWLLLFAASVASDVASWQDSKRLLQRSASDPAVAKQVQREVALQRALLAALIEGDAVMARADLEHARALGTGDGYDDLALAAVQLAEGMGAEAAATLSRWKTRASPLWNAGNQWARERLEAELAESDARATF